MYDVIDNLDDSIACDVHNEHMKHETDKIQDETESIYWKLNLNEKFFPR